MNEKEKIKKARALLLKGQIGEIYAKYVLKERGYNVLNLNNCSERLLDYFLRDLNEKFLIKKLLRENNGIPDFICKKNEDVSFAEVKTNNSGLSKNQIAFFKELKKYFRVIILNVSFDFNLKEIEIKECDEDYLNTEKIKREYYDKLKEQHKF
ncbi:MAG TPA: VRR-NUC domain-containing protein [Candidatus Nanoarchaeia archaeon]|nr:VRR-NUC domain-containing protein [Candidatus Nanoarchaeia archaeon]